MYHRQWDGEDMHLINFNFKPFFSGKNVSTKDQHKTKVLEEKMKINFSSLILTYGLLLYLSPFSSDFLLKNGQKLHTS